MVESINRYDYLRMPETATDGAPSVGGGGSSSRGGRGGGRSRGGGGNRGGGRTGNADSNGGNSRRGEGRGGGGGAGENNGRRSPQQHNHQQGGRNEQRKTKVGDHKVDMRKYERMITATQSNFSDIKATDPITEDCLICCKPNDIFGVGACRHPLCIECAIRIRVIANSEGCPVCRQPMEKMAFVFASADPTTASLSMPHIHPDEKRYKVCFQNKEASARYEQYLSHVCKLCVVDGERKEFASFVSLRQHMAATHQLSFCHHCVANLQLFSRERTTYSRAQLQEHIRGGDRDDRSQKGHPKCLFCEERFFDEDDRYRHLRREHFFCQLCETTGAAANVFFGKHDELLKHYEAKHFLCEVDECKKAGIAFATKLDLDIHTSREHGKVNLAVDFSFNDRQVGGPTRNRGGRQYGGGAPPPPPVPQGPRGVGLVPAAEPAPPRSDPSQFVVVPSAQASRPSLRYARQGGYNGLSDADAFPSLGPAVAASSAGINYASGPPVVVPSDFPRLKPQPNRPPPPPAVSAANIASGAAKKKEKKKETREEAFPSLGGSSRAQQQQQQETAQWARHTERFDVIDDDEREAFQTVGRHGLGPPPRVGPAVQPSRVAVIKRGAMQQQPPRGKQPAPMPAALSGEPEEDYPSLPPPAPTTRIDYSRVGGPLAQTSKWGKKKAEEAKKRPPPPPLPEPEMWPAMSSSTTAARPVENPDWQEVSILLSKKALAKRENAEKNARKKEEKRLAREAREAEERAAVRMDTEEEDEDEDEEEEEEVVEEVKEVKKTEPVLGLSEISRLITSAPPAETQKKDGKGRGKEQPKAIPSKKEEPSKTAASSSNSKKKDKKGGADSAPSPIDKRPPAPTTTVPSQTSSSSLGLIGSVLCLLAALCKLLFNSVYTSFVGGGDATAAAAAAAQNGSAAKPTAAAAAAADARARGLSTAPPPGISFAPPPGFGPPPGFENVVKRS